MHLRAPDESIDHTVEAVERYVDKASERGIDEIGFTEHVYYFEQTRPVWSLRYQLDRCRYDLEPYVDAVVEAKRRGYPVKLGLEVDYQPDRAQELDEILAPYPWDYLIGSIHFIDGLAIDQEPEFRRRSRRRAGVGPLLRTASRSGRVGRRPRPPGPDQVQRPGDRMGLGRFHRRTRKRLPRGLERRVAQAAREALPERRSARGWAGTGPADHARVRRARPQNVGRDLDRAIDHARAAGYETVTVSEQRAPRQEPLG